MFEMGLGLCLLIVSHLFYLFARVDRQGNLMSRHGRVAYVKFSRRGGPRCSRDRLTEACSGCLGRFLWVLSAMLLWWILSGRGTTLLQAGLQPPTSWHRVWEYKTCLRQFIPRGFHKPSALFLV